MEKVYRLKDSDLDYKVEDIVNCLLDGSRKFKKEAFICVFENSTDEEFIAELLNFLKDKLEITNLDLINAYGKAQRQKVDLKLNHRL